PVGVYNRSRLSNMGIGHGALDGGAGYTYFNEQTGYEFSAVAGLTYNFLNPSTQYQNGVDVHLDWGASRFLTKRLQVGLVGYLYNQASCDGGSGDRVGCFQSRVAGAGGQIRYTVPIVDLQGNVNGKAYKEFAAANRPDGWNFWLTYTLSPAEPAPASPRPKRMSFSAQQLTAPAPSSLRGGSPPRPSRRRMSRARQRSPRCAGRAWAEAY